MTEIEQLKIEIAGLRRQVRVMADVLLSNTGAIGSSLDAHLALLEALDNKAVLDTGADVQPALVGALESQHRYVGEASSALIHLAEHMDDGRDD